MRSGREWRLIRQAFRFELDPNEAQRRQLTNSVGAARYVYNWGLAESQREYELTGRRPKLGDLKSRLVELKKTQCPWLYEVSAHVGQQALVDLDRAYFRFLNGLKGGPAKSGFPRFKRKGERDSCRVYEVELSERHLRLPNIGRVRLKESRSKRGFEGRILSATIRRRADRWFCSLTVERVREVVRTRCPTRASDIVGVDFGLKSVAVIHDGNAVKAIPPAQALRKAQAKLGRLNRQLGRKQEGSRNRAKAQLNLARLHYKIFCQRQNFLHQISSELTRAKSVIVLEDLNLRAMQRNRRLALSIADAGLGELRRQLAYKSEWYGSTLIVADPLFPSTQLCSTCCALNEQVKGFGGLKYRRFDCTVCGLSLDRDENAALNLRRNGLDKLASELPEGLREVTPVGEEGSGSLPRQRVKPASSKQEASDRSVHSGTRRSAPKGALVRA